MSADKNIEKTVKHYLDQHPEYPIIVPMFKLVAPYSRFCPAALACDVTLTGITSRMMSLLPASKVWKYWSKSSSLRSYRLKTPATSPR